MNTKAYSFTALAPSVQVALQQLNITHNQHIQEIGAISTFLLLKKSGLTITRSVLWQLFAIESQCPLDAIDAPIRQSLQLALKNHPPVALFPEQKEMEFFMQAALDEAQKARQANEVPVGAVIVKQGKIIAQGHNRCVQNHAIAAHAEMNALFQAAQISQNYRLDDCDIYITLEPCAMCAGAIIQSRIARLIFALAEPKTGAAGSVVNLFHNRTLNQHTAIKSGILGAQSQRLLQDFFSEKRRIN